MRGGKVYELNYGHGGYVTSGYQPHSETLSKIFITIYSLTCLSRACALWFPIMLCQQKPNFGLKAMMAKVRCPFPWKKLALSLTTVFVCIGHKNFERDPQETRQ